MGRKIISLMVAAAVVLLWAGLQYAESWTLREHVIEGLRNSGPFGYAVASVLNARSVPVVLGLVILGIALEMYRKQKELGEINHEEIRPTISSKSQAKVEQSGNSSATGGSARIGDIKIILPPAPLSRPIVEQPKKSPEPKNYSLEMRDPIGETIHLDDDREVWRIGIGPNRRSLTKAVLLPLYFNPMKSDAGLDMQFSRTHLVFRRQGNSSTVAHGCWIDAYWDYIEIEQGETKYVILALAQPFPPRENIIWISNNRSDRNWSNKTGNNAFASGPIEPAKYECEALVMWGGSSEFRKLFKFDLDLKQLLQG